MCIRDREVPDENNAPGCILDVNEATPQLSVDCGTDHVTGT